MNCVRWREIGKEGRREGRERREGGRDRGEGGEREEGGREGRERREGERGERGGREGQGWEIMWKYVSTHEVLCADSVTHSTNVTTHTHTQQTHTTS